MIDIYTDTRIVAPWVVGRLPDMSQRTFQGRLEEVSSLGYSRGGRMVMGVLFSDHSPILKGVHVHMALDIPKGDNGSALRIMFGHAMAYAFDDLGCVRVTAHVPKRHNTMRKAIHTLGFTEEGCMKHGFLVDDCMIYGLTKRAAIKWVLHAGKNQHILQTMRG